MLGPLTPGAPDVVRAYPALYEVKRPAATTAYIEVDFHDVPRVAEWIIANTTVIGETIAEGLCAALGVVFVEDDSIPAMAPAQAETVQVTARMLRRGMSGADVRTLQAALIAYGKRGRHTKVCLPLFIAAKRSTKRKRPPAAVFSFWWS